MTPDEIRTRHYQRLNDYRNSQEYQESEHCRDRREGPFPSLLGNRWEINAEIYDEFLNMLPPLGWRGGVFYMCEFTLDGITAKFTKEGDRYYCEFARYPSQAAA